MNIHKPMRESDAGLSALFREPPRGYGIVPFYWWLGDPITRERLAWEVEQMKGHSLAGLQINYAHSCEGGLSWGLTYQGDPLLFSDAWWEAVGFLMELGKRDGFSVSLSDYTIGSPGQGYYADEILSAHPELHGQLLHCEEREVCAGEEIKAHLPEGLLNASFLAGADCTDLTSRAEGGLLRFTAPRDGRLLLIRAERKEHSLDPMHPLTGRQVCEKFFGRFESHFPGEAGNGLNFFFSDELDFNIRGKLWNAFFAEEFRARKGYDLLPLLPALFTDIGDRTPKVRLDYYDVIVQLEENYFRTVFEWHESRGMIYGCDHGGRGYDITEFGDYFRTQKFNQGPGCDQPKLSSDIVKNKVASSIAHLYDRPRVWLEGFYGSGWGTSSADFADAVARNFVMGHNLLSLHGLYYATHGGWWEWAPPCNGYHMPYWKDMTGFFRAVERMSFLLSQGRHVCDVGIVYPVAAAEADCGGEEASKHAFAAAEALYPQGIDLDFLDFESIERAEIRGGALAVSGECYRVVIVPAMRAVRFAMLEKLLAFRCSGGAVLFLGALPSCSDRAGRNDPVLDDMVRELASEPGSCLSDAADVVPAVRRLVPADIRAENGGGNLYVNHRRIGEKDLYMVYGVPRGTRCTFRARGAVSLWNPFDGKRYALDTAVSEGAFTTLPLPLDAKEFQILVFDRSGEEPDAHFPAETRETARFPLAHTWRTALLPCLDNRFGDYAIPPSRETIGAQLRMAAYAESGGALPPDTEFRRTERFSYGPYWKVCGPFADEGAFRSACEAGTAGRWESFSDYVFSLRYGVWNDPGQQGYHGLKSCVTDEFLTVGRREETATGTRYVPEETGFGRVYATRVVCASDGAYVFSSGEQKPDFFSLDGREQPFPERAIFLQAGPHRICAGYRACGRTHLAVIREGTASPLRDLAMQWYEHPGLARFDAREDGAAARFGFFRFTTPPGLKEMEIPCRTGSLAVWIGGRKIPAVQRSDTFWQVTLPQPEKEPAEAVLRLALDRGRYGGALIDEAVRFTCGEGLLREGDWAKIDGLSCYSGCVSYAQEVSLPEPLPQGRPVLRLADACSSVRVFVNGASAGIRVMGPWAFDLSGLLHSGKNELCLEISNTLANQYKSVPTRYGAETPSGLLGGAEIVFLA